MHEREQVDGLQGRAVTAGKILVDGQWRSSSDGEPRNVISLIGGSVLTTITEGTANRVDKSLHAMDKYTDMKL
jgi:acyl-CoA reductase-like NAD-dependent aldehyde dehydrogenase